MTTRARLSFLDPPSSEPELTVEEYAASFDDDLQAPCPLEKRSSLARALCKRRETKALDAARGAENDPEFALDENCDVAVAGAGLMGVSIATAFIDADRRARIYDPSEDARKSALERIARELVAARDARGERATTLAEARAIVAERCLVVESLDAIADCDVVVESIPEKLKLKSKFYRELDAVARRKIMLLTNTSSLQIDRLAEALPIVEDRALSRARFAGFHFFHPVVRRSLVEIARGAATSGATLARAAALAASLRKTPILVDDSPGFLVNRLLQAYLNEALALLDERVPPERLEALALAMGMEAPPLRIIDEIGVDVSLRSGWSFLQAFPSRTHESKLLEELVRLGRLGRKTRLGFYRYGGATPWRNDAEFALDAATLARATAGVGAVDSSQRDDAALADRLALAVFYESARAIEEGLVGSFREADAALALALGFPRGKGGPAWWAFHAGLSELASFAQTWESVGARFDAPSLARERG